MRSRLGLSIMLVTMLLVQTLGLLAQSPEVGSVGDRAGAAARGGANDDFQAFSIEVGNETVETESWYNPDGSEVSYTFTGQEISITVTVKRLGNSATGKATQVTFEAVHPIGFVDYAQTWQTQELFGGMSNEKEIYWTPPNSHSELINGSLEGGWILRATVFHAHDNRNDNDVLEHMLPVAIDADAMDGTALSANVLTFLPFGYPGGGADADSIGAWQSENGGVVGSGHWRHSDPGSEYPSGHPHDRLVRGFWPVSDGTSQPSCGNSAQHEPGAPAVYSYYYCKQFIISGDYVSLDFHVRTWGRMGSGDATSIELWRTGGTNIRSNLSDYSPSTSETSWTNITWRPDSFEMGGHAWFMGMHFTSDTTLAEEGMHVDDWLIFGVEKVSNFTLDIVCDDPVSGYSAVPNQLLSLNCLVTNNGYRSAVVGIHSNVTNMSWMDPMNPAIRIDSSNPTHHGTDIVLPSIPPGNTTEMWINLSIPKGADVQSQTWNVWWDDARPFDSDIKGSLSMPVVITEQFSLLLTSSSPLLAATLLPGESSEIPMRLENTGNREATFTLTASFPEEGWSTQFVNLTGASFLPIYLTRGQAYDFHVNVTAASDSAPGEISFSVRAACMDCTTGVSGNEVIIRNIMVPELNGVAVQADRLTIVAEADDVVQSVSLDIFNLGNADARFNLDLIQSNWKMEGMLSLEQTSVLDAWDGETSATLILPMPYGLAPGQYSARVDVSSENDASTSDSVIINLEVLPTAIPWVSSEEIEESYIPGESSKSIKFEIRNDGNEADRFNLSLDIPDGMSADFTGALNNDQTVLIEPGASTNVTVEFTFAEDLGGELTLNLMAQSVNDDTRSASGSATFKVGSQNWLRLIAPEPVDLIEANEEIELLLVLRNQYTGIQSVSISLDTSEAANYMTIRIDENDRVATLQTSAPNDEHIIHVTIEASEDALINLQNETVTVTFRVWAKSNTIEDAQSALVEVTLHRMEAKSEGAAGGGGDKSVIVIILQWAAGSIIVLVLLGFLIREIFMVEEEEDEYGVYETSSSAMYGGVEAAPDMDSFGGAPSGIMPLGPDPSMVGLPSGAPPEVIQSSKDLVGLGGAMATTAPLQPAVPEVPAPVPVEPSEPVDAGPPPVPEAGLPSGWTMEQWQHYGAEWLRQQD